MQNICAIISMNARRDLHLWVIREEESLWPPVRV
jgi:hypothetical protein